MQNLPQRCRSIRLMLADVDGVLTDGGIILDARGVETKRFHVRDGMAIRLWQKAGHRFGLITLRNSPIVKLRVAELGIELVRQGIEDKLAAMRQIGTELDLPLTQVCYVGDDLPDLAAVRAAGLGVAVADACEELRQAAQYVTQAPGGNGAVREIIEMILKAQGRWEELIRTFG
jgi:3-deoxy-D-manno-octulosonate 8-phosphate phosphatase (KDO 8-P phosphatase)